MPRYLLLIFVLFQSILHAQSPAWLEMANDSKSNLPEIQKSYEQWKDSLIRIGKGSWVSRIFNAEKLEKAIELREEGAEHFIHWLSENQMSFDAKGNRIPLEKIKKQFRERITRSNHSLASRQGNWKTRGPEQITAYGSVRGIGRVFPFSVSPADSNIIFAGTPSGGLWRSLDHGNHWIPLTDTIAGLSTQAVKTHPTLPAICFFLCGGDFYKTLDTGNTWQLIHPSSATSGRILMDATDPATVYLGLTGEGLYVSHDTGSTFNFLNDTIPSAIRPGNPSVLYATIRNVFLRSLDGGLHFDSLTSPASSGTIFDVAVTPADTNYVYVVLKESGGLAKIARSLDGGNSFSLFSSSSNIEANIVPPSLAVHPFSRDTVMVAGEILSRSTDGGQTFLRASNYFYSSSPTLPYVHPDSRCIVYTGSSFWSGTDGGLYKSEDEGQSFVDKTAGISVTQFVSLDCSAQDTSVFMGGSWDNSVVLHRDSSWFNIFGGDGFDVAIHPGNPDILFGKNQYGYSRSFDGGITTNQNSFLDGLTESTYSMNTGYLLKFNKQNPNSLYLGIRNVWKSTDLGDSVHAISAFTNYLTAGFLFIGNPDTNVIFTRWQRTLDNGANWTLLSKPVYAVDPDEINKVWSIELLNNRCTIYFSTDTGITWHAIPSPDLPLNLTQSKIECANNALDGIFICAGGIYYLDNSLSNWQPFTEGLPNTNVSALSILPDVNIIRAATFGRGIWESNLFDPNKPLECDFIFDRQTICPGDSIQFYDNSLNAGPGYSSVYHWSFPGGVPTQSNLPNPKIAYPVAGDYNVTLQMTGTSGVDSITKSFIIHVEPAPILSSMNEGFESTNFPPYGWNWGKNPPYSHWDLATYYGGYLQSPNSLIYNDALIGSPPGQDDFISPNIDLTQIPDPVLKFDYLYGYDYLPQEADTLLLYYTYDCGVTKNYFFRKGGFDLMTDSINPNFTVMYDSSSWSSDTISLYALSSLSPFQIGFEIRSYNRCDFFIDNIQLASIPGVGIHDPINTEQNIVVFPNPVGSLVNIKWTSPDIAKGILRIISTTGQINFKKEISSNENLQLNTDQLKQGIYFLQIESRKGNLFRKMIK